MMTKKKTSASRRVKFAWALPAIALLLFAFAEPEYKTKPVEPINQVTDVQTGEKEYVIKGKVVRKDNGKPLPGASVILKGTTIGTVTDIDGKFTLTDPNPEVEKDGFLSSELVISYVGFETNMGKVGASGTALENGRFTFKLKEGVIVIDIPDYKNVPPPPPPPPAISDDGEELFIIVEDLPKYPGGMQVLAMHIQEQKKKLASKINLNGKTKIAFTVNEMGKITNIKRVTSDNDLVGKAGVVIVEHLADWTPGKQHGKPVPVNYILPIEF